ncbi:MAG: twin-arginine translocation signal domain-containing protein, partial [Kiritimatiellia bacterium]
MKGITRRDFLKTSLVGSVVATFGPSILAETPETEVVVVHGKDAGTMLTKGVERLGGWSAFVPKGKKVTLKVNAAWANLPEHGSNT